MEQGERVVRLQVAREGVLPVLKAIAGVSTVGMEEGAIVVRSREDLREQIAAAAVPFGLLEFTGRARLEDVYLAFTREPPASNEVAA